MYGNSKVLLLWCCYAKSQYCTYTTFIHTEELGAVLASGILAFVNSTKLFMPYISAITVVFWASAHSRVSAQVLVLAA